MHVAYKNSIKQSRNINQFLKKIRYKEKLTYVKQELKKKQINLTQPQKTDHETDH